MLQVRNLIDLHAQYNKVVMDCFNKENVFQNALKNAFQDFINKDNRVSKLLAKFVNDVLKKVCSLLSLRPNVSPLTAPFCR